jgi:hypothetical protein
MAASPGPRRGCIVRPNAHDWKSCEGNTSAGSNPALSASVGDAPQVEVHLWRLCLSIHVSRCHIDPTVLDPAGQCTSASVAGQVHRLLFGSPIRKAKRTPSNIGRQGTEPIATATRAHCWRRHQQCPSATPATDWAYAKSAPGACWMQCTTRHLGSGHQHPERPLTRECQKLD